MQKQTQNSVYYVRMQRIYLSIIEHVWNFNLWICKPKEQILYIKMQHEEAMWIE